MATPQCVSRSFRHSLVARVDSHVCSTLACVCVCAIGDGDWAPQIVSVLARSFRHSLFPCPLAESVCWSLVVRSTGTGGRNRQWWDDDDQRVHIRWQLRSACLARFDTRSLLESTLMCARLSRVCVCVCDRRWRLGTTECESLGSLVSTLVVSVSTSRVCVLVVGCSLHRDGGAQSTMVGR